jgi:hypothetical protein
MRLVGLNGKTGRCADCKFIVDCATIYFNTPVGNWNIESNDCVNFTRDESLDNYIRERVNFT